MQEVQFFSWGPPTLAPLLDHYPVHWHGEEALASLRKKSKGRAAEGVQVEPSNDAVQAESMTQDEESGVSQSTSAVTSRSCSRLPTISKEPTGNSGEPLDDGASMRSSRKRKRVVKRRLPDSILSLVPFKPIQAPEDNDSDDDFSDSDIDPIETDNETTEERRPVSSSTAAILSSCRRAPKRLSDLQKAIDTSPVKPMRSAFKRLRKADQDTPNKRVTFTFDGFTAAEQQSRPKPRQRAKRRLQQPLTSCGRALTIVQGPTPKPVFEDVLVESTRSLSLSSSRVHENDTIELDIESRPHPSSVKKVSEGAEAIDRSAAEKPSDDPGSNGMEEITPTRVHHKGEIEAEVQAEVQPENPVEPGAESTHRRSTLVQATTASAPLTRRQILEQWSRVSAPPRPHDSDDSDDGEDDLEAETEPCPDDLNDDAQNDRMDDDGGNSKPKRPGTPVSDDSLFNETAANGAHPTERDTTDSSRNIIDVANKALRRVSFASVDLFETPGQLSKMHPSGVWMEVNDDIDDNSPAPAVQALSGIESKGSQTLERAQHDGDLSDRLPMTSPPRTLTRTSTNSSQPLRSILKKPSRTLGPSVDDEGEVELDRHEVIVTEDSSRYFGNAASRLSNPALLAPMLPAMRSKSRDLDASFAAGCTSHSPKRCREFSEQLDAGDDTEQDAESPSSGPDYANNLSLHFQSQHAHLQERGGDMRLGSLVRSVSQQYGTISARPRKVSSIPFTPPFLKQGN